MALFVDEVHIEVVLGDRLVPNEVLGTGSVKPERIEIYVSIPGQGEGGWCVLGEDLFIQPYALVAVVEVYELLLLVVSAAQAA